MYYPSQKIRITGGKSLGRIYDPYFNRDYRHFCSHQHTPFRPEPSGCDAGVLTENVLYFAHPVFRLYANYGSVILKNFLLKALTGLIGRDLPVTTTLPSQGRVSLLEQKAGKRYVCHALYAATIQRGMRSALYPDRLRETRPVQVIEELDPLYNVKFSFRLPKKIRKVTLEPEGAVLPFTEREGLVELTLPKLVCHAMIVLHR